MTKGKSGKQHIFEVIFSLIFIIGVGVGAIFCAYANENTDESLYNYLQSFFAEFAGSTDKWAVTKRAIAMNIRVFIVVFIAGFFSLGYILSGVCIAVKGFVTGFAAAAFVKYYGIAGIWLSLCNFPSGVIFIPTMIFLAVMSAGMSGAPQRKERGLVGAYIIMSAIAFIMMCIAALTDGYLTTVLMKMVVRNIAG